MSETSVHIDLPGFPTLRYLKRQVQEKNLDIGYACFVGDKSIRIFPNNRVEISEVEFRDRENQASGETLVHYWERPSWVTQYPESLDIKTVKASLDYAYMLAGLPSLFFMTNLSLARFESKEEERRIALSVYRVLYPHAEPWITELNSILDHYARDLDHLQSLQ